MSNINYRNEDCTDAIKIEKIPSIKSFFSKCKSGSSKDSNSSSSGRTRNDKKNNVQKKYQTTAAAVVSSSSKKRNFFQNHYKVKSNDEKRMKIVLPIKAKTEKDETEVIDMTLEEDDK